jgi:hypothetical protein
LLPNWIAQLFAEEAWGRTAAMVAVIMFIISHALAFTALYFVVLQILPTFYPSDSVIYHLDICDL